MQNLPRVSIVTPTYNQAEYLAETIDSVLAQDYPNIEYIVLDDGSTDSTSEVLRRYGDRVRWERHDNIGQANTLNRGWKMAQGSLIGYLSSDDRLETNAISKLVTALIERPDAVVAYCDFNLIDAVGRCFRTVKTEDFNEVRLRVELVCQPGPGAMFRREVFDRTGGWAGHLRQVPDFEFWLRASKFGTFVRIPQVLAHYRIHDDSASFRYISSEQSVEVISVMTNYWDSQIGPAVTHSLSTAHLIAAKNHAQSGRIWDSFREWATAIRLCPSVLAGTKSWSMLASGFMRRFVYHFRGRGRRT